MSIYKFIEQREPNSEEKKRGAEVVFVYENELTDHKETVLACACHESWEQFGAPSKLLWKNILRVEEWRENLNSEI